MEDHPPPRTTVSNTSTGREKNSNGDGEPVRSRWTPKPEQILILESIFNSGMVNPPKEETVRIRKLLEKFGPVGDANVFYWFQNRRSRSRRRQRQLQAAATTTSSSVAPPNVEVSPAGGGGIMNIACSASTGACYSPSNMGGGFIYSNNTLSGNQIMGGAYGGLPMQSNSDASTPPSILCYSHTPSGLDFPSGIITVFINGVATQVPEGPVDVKAVFGEEIILVHSSGLPVSSSHNYGTSYHTLQHGEAYFLVPRLS